MAFLSQLIDKPVLDNEGQRIGKLKDLVAREYAEGIHPVIEAIVIDRRGETVITPFSSVAVFIAPMIPLKFPLEELPSYAPNEEDFFLARDVLDKQIIDTEGARVVRVNDLELMRINGTVVVSNVDIGGLAILRRIGLIGTSNRFLNKLGIRPNAISWDNVELLLHDQAMRLRVPADKLKELHPADIAEIISDLSQIESGEFLEALPVEHLADTLEEVEPDFQASLVERMPDERVADILEEMSPDEAADLLAELPHARSAGLLSLMQAKDADGVRKLMTYPDDSAGGLMTTEYAVVHHHLTVHQAIQALRETGNEAETIYYVYVLDDKDRLVGVFSLSQLIFTDPDTPVQDIMHKRVVSVSLLTEQDEIAQLIAKYDLLAIPVVDDQIHLQGIVTSDDALDKIIPTAWKKRLPRFYR